MLKILPRRQVPLEITRVWTNPALVKPTDILGFSKRDYHVSCVSCGRWYESNPRGEYRDEKKLQEEIRKNQRENLWGLKTGLKELRLEVGRWAKEVKKVYDDTIDDSHMWIIEGDKTITWKFDNDKEALKNWQVVTDSDHNEGFSRAELTLSATGKGLFHGFVNTTPPKDGRVKYAGYCMLRSIRPMKSFKRGDYHDWSDYTHLTMRVRGDGRSYVLNIATAGYYDIMWNDSYHYVLYTRGGPYWQYVKVPFSKFAFGSKGRIQDLQEPILLDRVSGLVIGAAKNDGPFCLEIDWIGLENDDTKPEEFAYETYRIPKYIAGV